MKNILSLIFITCLSVFAIAQGPTAITFGYLGQGQATVSDGDKSIEMTISGGHSVSTGQFTTMAQDKVEAIIGFPPMIPYFPIVFDQELFISKGYFSDYVQIKWGIVSQQDRITKIKVYRKPLGDVGDSLLIATIAPDDFTYRDEYAEKGVLYEYTIFAEGLADDLRLPGVNYKTGVGFAFPFGTAAGRITFEGGTAVEGVQILAETNGTLGGKSIYLNGTDAYLSVAHQNKHNELNLENGFSMQMWAKFEGMNKGVLFSKGENYELAYEPGYFTFRVGDDSLLMPYNHPSDTFFHVTAVYDAGNELSLYIRKNEFLVDSLSIVTDVILSDNIDVIHFGRAFAQSGYYKGKLDEIRLWNIPLTYEAAKSNFSRYLSGTEANLSGYWKLNSGIGSGFYDFSREGFSYNENHGRVWRGEWSLDIPAQSQLAYRGVTDDQGNYVVRGFPYETSGSQYTFTPIFETHEFEPTQQLRYVGDGSSIHNGLDFKDVSSFPVSGTVKYRNSYFPTEGISILIDGNPAIDEDGGLITTDNFGRFTVDVPIGFHSLRLNKNGHVFDQDGRFPPKEEEEITKYNFQKPLAGLEFIDNTVVKLVGKVVGGPLEAEKQTGFGLSKNNIGNAQITITSEKGWDITTADSTVIYDERDIESHSRFNTKTVTIYPDEVTGEYVAYLPPEKYVFTSVTAGDYVFGDEYKVSIDLETTFKQTNSYEELVMASLENGNAVPGYAPFDSSAYDLLRTESILDTIYTYGIKDFIFEKSKDFILRVKPGIEVTNNSGTDIFGESTYTYDDELKQDEIALIDSSGDYTFGHPVFFQQKRYFISMSVFEEYTNVDNGQADRVPVKDGKMEIINDFAINNDPVNLELDEKGKTKYSFVAGLPQLNKSTVDPSLSFTRPFSLTAITGENGTIRTIWKEDEPLRGIVFGSVAQGNDFVTAGPNQIITILRDPPGSNSNSFLEKGSSFTTTTNWSTSLTSTTSLNASFLLGGKIVTWAGVGAGVIKTAEVKNSVDLGLELTTSVGASGEIVNTAITTKRWSSSQNPFFVSAQGDVFVGNSTNIVFGSSIAIQPIPVTDEECASGECDGIQNGDFKLGPRIGLRLNPEFGTMFIYTQAHIEGALLPNLRELRNNSLSYSPNPENVIATNEVIYLSLVAPDDERFGSPNYSNKYWGEEATAVIGRGPSYLILVPPGLDSLLVSDTISYFNKQIEGWERVMRDNEEVKVKAKLLENISFDGGSTYSSSVTTESSGALGYNFNVALNTKIAAQRGFKFDGLGVELGISQSVSVGGGGGGGVSSSESTTYGYELIDDSNSGSQSDYYSIDVKKPSDGYGPVFVTRAGVTSCPYEGEAKTKYFEPGQHILSVATLQVEKPEITIVNPLVANVPSNRQAEITLELKNNSENEADLYYNLNMVEVTNFNGAVLSIDGSVLTGDGREIRVPYGTTVTKILKVAKGSDDVNDYEDIELKFGSQCDVSIYDTQTFSVYFQPGCSDISLVSPVDKWVINTNTVPEKTQNIVFNNYDVQNSQFKYVKFQYKASSSSQWLTNMIFYNGLLVGQAEFDGFDDPKSWLDQSGNTLYAWDMSDLPDRKYDLRVVSVCEIAPGQTAETPSDIHSGTKDVKRPVVFGAPQPADGILSANDEILIQFDEVIEDGLLTPFNFSVKGVLNSAKIRHSASVDFDGVNDYVRIEDGLDLTNKSFTVEFWIKRDELGRKQAIYSKGYNASNIFEMGFNASNKFYLNVGGEVITSINSYTDPTWNHYAVVYSFSDHSVTVFKNDENVITKTPLTNSFTGQGSILLGKSMITDADHLNGNIHEFRVWTKARQLGDIYAKMSTILSGKEVGLVGYWPMDEALGDRAFDLARFRHAILFADWEVSPKGKAYAFDGVDDHLEINSGSTIVITDEMDYTIEFWFKGTPGQTNTVMFSSGKGDGSDVYNDPTNSLSIGFDAEGQLFLINNGETLMIEDKDYLDDNWHHFAFSLLRQANVNLSIDGEQKNSLTARNFGGLSGASMTIGARGYIQSLNTKVFDQHFDGSIDEFRIWKLGKKLSQVNLNSNSRLIGDEIGLVSYYPFEYYQVVTGVKIMYPSIADQWINPYGDNAGDATSVSGANYSDFTPNIKDARPVDKIDFDWAVNGDKIIITPSSSFTSLIEQTVLEITIQNVEDLYENRLASPVSWTAFVDRNQIKWDTDLIIAKKQLYDEHSFTIDVINHGGTESNFEISNLPLWLKATPSSGVLAPASTKKIKLEVNEGLNTGNYTEDVILTSDFGFDEKLTIELQVFSPEPEWNTNPYDFQYSMNLVAQLEIEGVLSSDRNDRVAAFVGDEIRGDANLKYIEELDLYEVYLDIFSNTQSGEIMELRVWDSDKGVEYRDVTPVVTFNSNEVIGTPSNPQLIEAGETGVQYITFERGWTWASVNINSPVLNDINTLMADVDAATGDQIKGVSSFDVFTEGFGWAGSLSTNGGLDNGKMYLFNLSEHGELAITGSQASPATAIQIDSGWNWIGFIPRFNMTLEEAFAFFNPTTGDLIKSQFAFAVYDENLGWLGSLNYMEPGKGYLYNSASGGTLRYPETSLLSAGRLARVKEISDFKSMDRNKYPYTMTILADIADVHIENLVLAAYSGDELRGIIEPENSLSEEELYFMTIHGNDELESLNFIAFDPKSGDAYSLDQTITFSANNHRGDMTNPFELNGLTQIVGDDQKILVFPNPFSEEFIVDIESASELPPKVVLTDMSGRLVSKLKAKKSGRGWSIKFVDEEGLLATGIYVLSVYSEGSVKSLNLIKK